MSDPIRVNGRFYSWGSITFKVNGERYYGFDSINYGDKREYVQAYGMGRHHAPIGRSEGKYSTDVVKVRGLKHAVQALREAIAKLSADEKSYGNVDFQGIVQFIKATGEEITVELDRCAWMNDSAGHEESADPLKEEFELQVMLIRRNGLHLYDGTEGEP